MSLQPSKTAVRTWQRVTTIDATLHALAVELVGESSTRAAATSLTLPTSIFGRYVSGIGRPGDVIIAQVMLATFRELHP